MPYIGINTGSTANDGTGDTLIQGAVKINQQFQELYNNVGVKVYTTTSVSKSIGLNEFCVVTAPNVQLSLPAGTTDGSTVQVCVCGVITSTQLVRTNLNTKIMGLAENMTIDQPNITITLVGIQTITGNPSSFDWRII
jgi:flagellar basal body P-ring protein FlgI